MARGGFGNMQQIMQQAQRMQQQMEQAKQRLEEMTVTATSGGGMVSVVATGGRKIVSITIDPQAVDPDDVEMLQDLVCAGVNQALEQAEAMAEQEMGKITGGMGIPGM